MKSLTILLLLSASFLQAEVVWEFEEGTEDWMIADFSTYGTYQNPLGIYPVSHVASGGFPGGYIAAEDPSSQTFTFRMPPETLLRVELLPGGSLDYQISATHSNWQGEPYVILDCGDVSLVTVVSMPLPGQWIPVHVEFNSGEFFLQGGGAVDDAEFAQLLSQVEQLYIVAEYGAQVYETTSLDSVVLDPGAACDSPALQIQYLPAEDAIQLHWQALPGVDQVQVLASALPWSGFEALWITADSLVVLPLDQEQRHFQIRALCP